MDAVGLITVACDTSEQKLTVRVDRCKIVTKGKPALGKMLLRLHMYRCTADVQACRCYYEELSKVDSEHLEWRKIVFSKCQPRWLFVQANTYVDGADITLKEYEPTKEGLIQSWAERAI